MQDAASSSCWNRSQGRLYAFLMNIALYRSKRKGDGAKLYNNTTGFYHYRVSHHGNFATIVISFSFIILTPRSNGPEQNLSVQDIA
jgi:hypothetical protein